MSADTVMTFTATAAAAIIEPATGAAERADVLANETGFWTAASTALGLMVLTAFSFAGAVAFGAGLGVVSERLIGSLISPEPPDSIWTMILWSMSHAPHRGQRLHGERAGHRVARIVHERHILDDAIRLQRPRRI